MRIAWRRARKLAWLPVLLLCACAHQPSSTHREGHRDELPPLLTPASLQAERSASQVVRGAFGAREMTFNCVLAVKGDTLTVIGLTALGVRAFTLRYDGREVAVENTLPIPEHMTPERLLSDIQLVFWPLAALQDKLNDAGWQLSEPYSGTRRLRRGDTLIAEVHYERADAWQGRSWLVNLQHGYTLGIDSTSPTAP
jgi:hypothetical protein